MGWREADRLSRVAFSEVALQATYAFRQGNPVPPGEGPELVERSRRRVSQSKTLIAALLALLALGSAALLRAPAGVQSSLVPVSLPAGLFRAGVLTGLTGLQVVLLWWNGLQALPTLLDSAALAVLETLPVDRETLRKAAVLVYLRLFDIPAVVVLVGTPLLVGLALGPLAGLATLPMSGSAVALALALSLLTGRFFVRRIRGSRGGGGAAIVRWAYLLLWLLPAFGLLAFVTASPPFFRALAVLTARHAGVAADGLSAVYPFSLAVWPALVAGGPGALGAPPEVGSIAVGAGILYVGLAAYAGLWLYGSVGSLGAVPPTETSPGLSSPFELRPQSGPLAVMTKDLRLASRTPGYAFLILLPLLDAVALGLVTYVGAPGSSASRGIGLGAVTAAALLATFFGPAFFALEVIAQSYARTLPLAPRTLAVGKLILVGSVFLAAGGLVLAITVARVSQPLLFAGFIGAELPAVLAAGLLELALIFRWSRTRGLPVTNLYAGAWNVVIVSLPGVALAAAPLAAFLALGLLGMALVGVAELAIVAPLALAREAT